MAYLSKVGCSFLLNIGKTALMDIGHLIVMFQLSIFMLRHQFYPLIDQYQSVKTCGISKYQSIKMFMIEKTCIYI